MATSEYEAFDAERRRPLTSNRADVEEYLRNLYERSMGDAPVSPVATFATDLTPQPSRKPSFDSMLGVDFPAFDNVRKQNELELEADRQAADDAVAAAGLPARPLPGGYGAPPVIAAGPRRPLSPAATEDGSGGPVGYLAALRRAQGMDDLSAAVGRSNAAMQQLANITSRGVFQPQALSPMPSEVAKEEKRRQVVMDYLRQQREDANAAVDNEYKRGLLKRMAEPKPTPPAKPVLTQEQFDRLTESQILANNRRGMPKPSKAPKPTDTGPKLNKAAEILRKEFNGLPVVKQYNEVDSYYRKMKAAESNPSPAGDISLVFNFMKLQDPGSTVMQGEQADARNAGGVDERVRAAYNRAISGQSLTPEQRKDFVAQGRSAFETHAAQLNAAAERYTGIAKKSGADPEDVVIRPPSQERPAQPSAPPSGKVHVVKGSESLYIDPSDVADAVKDGYQVVSK